MREYANGQVEKFLTTQHERDKETGLDYRGARFYDSDIARFNSLDPLAAAYPSLSDYSYVAGNPIAFMDPSGMEVEGHWYGLDGTYYGDDGKGDNNVYINRIGKMSSDETAADMRKDYDECMSIWGEAPWANKLDITHSEFLYFAGVVKDEDASSWEASNAIAGAVLNQLAWKRETNPNVTLTQRLDKTSTVGSKKSIYAGATDERSMNAKRGTINALLGLDLSNGAVYWDGFDFAAKGVTHTKAVNMGLLIHSAHFSPFVEIWNTGNLLSNYSGGKYTSVHQSLITDEDVLRWVATGRNNGKVLYESSAQVGRTIFWKLSTESQ